MATPNLNREAVIQAAARISRLREELTHAEAQLDHLLDGEGGEAVGQPEYVPGSRLLQSLEDASLNQRIIGLLDGNAHTDFDAEGIAGILSYPNLTTVRSALARLSDGKNDKIKRTSRGRYASIHYVPPMQFSAMEAAS